MTVHTEHRAGDETPVGLGHFEPHDTRRESPGACRFVSGVDFQPSVRIGQVHGDSVPVRVFGGACGGVPL